MSNCLICKTETTQIDDEQLKVTYDVCPKCDFISKQKSYHLTHTEEKSRYDTHQNDTGDPGYINMFMNMINIHLKPLKNVKNILDFGSGPYPALKNILVELGYTVADYDPFYNPNEEYKKHKYDLVVSTEVIEHFSEPMKELEHIYSLIKENGYLLIMTNFRLMENADFPKWWYRRDHTHVSFFNVKTFQHIAKTFNMNIIEHNNKNIILFQK